MFKFIKRQWLRLKQSWNAFKREWRFNHLDSTDHLKQDKSFVIMGLGALRGRFHDPSFGHDEFELHPPYRGQALNRLNGHAFTLKYAYFDDKTGNIRYYEKPQKIDGWTAVDMEWFKDYEEIGKNVSRETNGEHL